MKSSRALCTWVVMMTIVVASLTVTTWRPLFAQDDVGRDLPAPTVDAAASVIPPLGAPGTSFRYVQTFGVAGQPYIEDAAHLNYPAGVAVEGGMLWIAEERGRRALKLSAPGVLLSQIGLAGQRYATGESFETIADVDVAPDGSIWLVDRNVRHVVQFDADGNVLKKLGQSYSSGPGNDQFNWPTGVAVDAAGNVYVSDTSNQRIQIFDNTGAYRATLGATGVCAQDNAHFCWPYHLDFGPGNLLYIADHGNQRVQIYSVASPYAPVYVATIGETGQGGDSNTRFDGPAGVAADSRYIYVADEDNHRVQVFNQTTRAYVATLGTGWGAGQTNLRHPLDVAVDAAGNIFIADNGNARVQQYNGALSYVRTFGVTGVPYLTDASHWNTPAGLAVAADNRMFLTEEFGNRLIAASATGVPLWTVGAAGVNVDLSGNDRLNRPADVALAPNGNLYVADAGNSRVQVFNASGSYVATIGSGEGQGNTQFSWPRGVFVAQNGALYVADSENERVQVFNSTGAYQATIGVTGQAGADNQHFDNPRDVAVDSRGVIYVADAYNHRVQIFDASYNYLRTLGVTGAGGDDFAHFAGPSQLAIDSSDRVYVASQWNHYVYVFDKDGGFLTRIGRYGSLTSQFLGPHGLAVNPMGELYVADFDNHRVQKFAFGTPNWRQVNISGFGDSEQGTGALVSFGGKLTAGTYMFGGGANLWQLNGGWTQAATGGLGDPTNVGITRLFEFGGQLYAGVDNWDEAANRSTGAQLLRSADGTTWNPVMTGGFGRIDNGGIFAIDAFSGTLYAGTYSYTSTHGAELWRSATGNAGDWQQVVPNGFGTPNNRAIWSLADYNGYLYAGTFNTQSGPEIWRSSDGLSWNRVATNGFGASSLTMIFALEPFNGYLYAAAWSNPSLNTTDSTLWRCQTCDGSDWQPVTPLRFGNAANVAVESLIVYNRMLYAFTANLSTGMEVWRTSDGATWAQIGFAGLGDANNYYPLYDNATVIHNGNLYVGVWNNAGGGKIWQYIPERATVDITDPTQPATLVFTPTTGGKSTVQIPANALDQPTELVYEPFTPATRPDNFAFAGSAFELNAYRNNALMENLQFQQPVTVILEYTDADVAGMDETRLMLHRWDPAASAWVDAACGAYDRQPAQNRLSVPVCHLSQFGLFGAMEYLYLPAVRR
jgi:sugar lactone lactonase YvrE